MDNLVLLCRRHHRLAHEGGFGVSMGAESTVRFSYPDGRPLPFHRDGRFREDVVDIRHVNRRNGLSLGPETLPPRWHGERMDEDLALPAMQSLE